MSLASSESKLWPTIVNENKDITIHLYNHCKSLIFKPSPKRWQGRYCIQKIHDRFDGIKYLIELQRKCDKKQ